MHGTFVPNESRPAIVCVHLKCTFGSAMLATITIDSPNGGGKQVEKKIY